MFSTNEASLSQAASAAASTAIRSLNVDFVRRGIVVSSADDTQYALDPKIVRLVDSLKGYCKTAGTRELGEISTAIQIWKERSLHHTLQTLDQARLEAHAPSDGIRAGGERQIQAIELHEKAGRDVKEAVLRVLQNIVDAILKHIEGFTTELAVIVRALIKPELEEELTRERAVTERLLVDKQRFLQEYSALQNAHATLTKRMHEWEHDESGGGDALLCRQLRQQVKDLNTKQAEMETRMRDMEQQNAQWKYEMIAMRTELETAHKTLAMTRAMHEKETKQLVELVHVRGDQLDRVRQATAVAKTGATAVARGGYVSPPAAVISYDPLSGRSICYQSPPKATTTTSPSKPLRPVLACLAPSTQSHGLGSPTASPNKKRTVASARPTATANRQDDEHVDPASPQGRVSRPFSPHGLH